MQFKNARLEDLFHQHCTESMRGAANGDKSIKFSNPFQVSGSVEMPSIFSTKGTFHELQEKQAPLGAC